MSSEERGRILRMVSEGKLTPTEAEELLTNLDPDPTPGAGMRPPMPPMSPAAPMPPAPPRTVPRRSLIIQVTEGGTSKVNVRIPLGLASAAGKFIPRHAMGALAGHDIDLQQLLDNLSSSDSGTLLEVQDENDRVVIAVE